MRLSLPLQKCLHGKSDRMPPKVVVTMAEVGMAGAGGGMIIIIKAAGEAMRGVEEKEEAGEEAAAEVEGCKEAGERGAEEGEVVTTRDSIKIWALIRGEAEREVLIEEAGATKEAPRSPATIQAIMTILTKMETGIKREVAVEEAGEEEAEEDGEGEEVKILIKEDSLNSFFNMAARTTTKLALIKAATTLVEGSSVGH